MTASVPSNILFQSIEHSNLAHTISYVGGDMELAYVNQAFLDQTGYDRDEVIGRNCRFLQGDGTDPQAIQKIRESIAECKSLDIEILNYKKGGIPFWNRLRMSPVYDENKKVIAFIGIQSDVTHIREQNRVEQERQRLEALGRLTGNISHEIKNALQPVKLMSDILQDWDALDEKTLQKCLRILNENVAIADQVTKDVLRFSRKSDDVLETITLQRLRDDVARFTTNLLHSRIDFEKNILDDFPSNLRVKISQNQLYQIIMNLVNNALYAMEDKGTLTFHFETQNINSKNRNGLTLNDGEYLCIGIEDTGCGMDDKVVQSALDPFYSTKPPGEGTGLGLSISQRLVQNWNGDLAIKSEKNKGSVFTIYLPIVC